MRVYLPSIQIDFFTQVYGLAVDVKEGLLHGTNLKKTLRIIICDIDWLDFIMCVTSIPSIGHRLYLCAHVLMLFHLI